MKKFLAIILSIVALMSMVIPANAEGTTMWVYQGSLRLRSSCSSSSSNNVICSIPNGMPVVVLEDLGTWSKVKYNNHTGYVVDEYLTPTPASETPTTVEQAFGPLRTNISYNEDKPITNDIYVYNIQVCLRQAGRYSGPRNGNYDEATYNAVCSFQAAYGLTVDGIVGENTKTLLWNRYESLLNTDGIKMLSE